ncbi:MAG: hypothetical protein CTY38_00790 [Methylotenera sp.]|uniref:hypothetical protein n=1 Tax=Methylotenera sp. TaxID=2051956 RepID=UPI000D4CBC85|nr:hypothetical protein [Methylotenera sp.]PPC84615.1 MAG: hypothetical protein CTY38_00790 [Methylotenera sp.]
MSIDILYASNGDIDINGFGHQLLPNLPGNYELTASAEEALNEDDGDPDFTIEIGDTYTYRKIDTDIFIKVTVSDNGYGIDLFTNHSEESYQEDVSSQQKIPWAINVLTKQYEEEALVAQVKGLIAAGESQLVGKLKIKL